jgi:nitrite reductase (NO-forming)
MNAHLRRAALPAAIVLALAVAAPATAAVVEVRMTAQHRTVGLLPGTRMQAWTFNGSIPGPLVRARVGDTIRITLRNADHRHGHSIDFHASEVDPMTTMATVRPGATRTFSFVARRPGVFMYHCGTSPVLRHVGMGMYGMIVVDPPAPRPDAQEVMLVQSEFYGRVRKRGGRRLLVGGLREMLELRPAFTAFNGVPLRYLRRPIAVRVGRPVRIYLVDAGPSLGSAFHVVGEIFDAFLPDGGTAPFRSDVSTGYVPAGGGAIFELTFDRPGTYPFLTHELAVAHRGAMGRFVAR